jgi:hypothetical protein
MTVRLPDSAPRREETPNGGTYLGLVFLLGCAGGFIALTSMILPQIRGLILVAAGMCAFIALHYFTWGRWMMRTLEESQELEAAQDELVIDD